MEYTINVAIDEQNLYTPEILSVNGTVDIIRCNFSYDSTWDNFPARQAIFESKGLRKSYVASIADDSCIIPWEALVKEGDVRIALVGTNTDGQVQRTETKTIVKQVSTLQGGVNSITPTPDQYAQFIAQVEEIIGQAGVLSVNGMTGDVTLTYSDVDALPDSTVIPTKTSDLQNDSGFITSIPSEYVTETELQTAISGKADSSSLSTVATTGDYDDLIDKPTIPSRTSQLQNDSNFVSDSSYVHTDNNFTNAEKTKLAGIEAGAEVNVKADWNAQSGDAQILNKPTIPTKTSDLTNDSGFLDSSDFKTINNESIAGSGNIAITGLPSVTSSDNGKVLRVVDGTWTAVSLPSASGVNF